jgi:hypothetical protein
MKPLVMKELTFLIIGVITALSHHIALLVLDGCDVLGDVEEGIGTDGWAW